MPLESTDRCRRASALIDRCLDGATTAEEGRAVESHVADCPRCRELWDLRCRVRDRLARFAAAGPAAPPRLRRRITDSFLAAATPPNRVPS